MLCCSNSKIKFVGMLVNMEEMREMGHWQPNWRVTWSITIQNLAMNLQKNLKIDCPILTLVCTAKKSYLIFSSYDYVC